MDTLAANAGVCVSYDSTEEMMYQVRYAFSNLSLSQCRIQRSFKIPISRPNRWQFSCCICDFSLTYTFSGIGIRLTNAKVPHSCEVSDHILYIPKLTSPAANKEFLSRYIAEHVRNGVKSPKRIIEIVRLELGCAVSQSTASEALGIAISKLSYDVNNGFNHLTEYIRKINESGGFAKLETISVIPCGSESESERESPTERFHQVFVALRNQRNVGKYATFFSFDAAHMKGNRKGMTMICSTQDLNGCLASGKSKGTNGRVTILAQAITPTEDKSSWTFFLKCFKASFPEIMATFSISDRDKGLIAAMLEIYPHLPHSKCLRHLSENFKKKFHSQEYTNVLKSMALSYKPEDCSSHMEVLRSSERGSEMISWIEEAEPNLWVRSKIAVPRLNVSTSNSVEVVFHAISEFRYLPVLDFFLRMETYVCSSIYENYIKVSALAADELLPRIKQKLNQEFEQSVFYSCQRTGEQTGVLTGTSHMRSFSVDVSKNICSCGKYQEQGYPCAHAIALLVWSGKDPSQFCHPSAYGKHLQMMYRALEEYRPTMLADLLSVPPTNLAPPIFQAQRGRPKSCGRIESQTVNPRERKKRTVVCPVCSLNHYAKCCPQRNHSIN